MNDSQKQLEEVAIANLSYLEQMGSEHSIENLDLDRLIQSLNLPIESNPVKNNALNSSRDELAVYRRNGHLYVQSSILKNSDAMRDFELEPLIPNKMYEEWYCHSVGIECDNIKDHKIKEWIYQKIEADYFKQPFSVEQQSEILEHLIQAEFLENFLHTKFVGKKRFSLEGAETVIPMLNAFVAQAKKLSVKKIYFGMAHRGRLNVLINVLKKPLENLLRDFDEHAAPNLNLGTGDVIYHKGYQSHDQSIELSLTANPSHLESVNTVVEGQARAHQDLLNTELAPSQIIPFLIHGDASFAGQGVVYETLQMSRLEGYKTGGTLHLIINNHIGFTTTPKEGRSTLYCSDLAHAFGIPVFHVSAEQPEICVKTLLLAFEIRQKFYMDVIIDLNCYRKYGHNEGDEPSFTQPTLYNEIRDKQTIRTLYFNNLLNTGKISEQVHLDLQEKYKNSYQDAFLKANEKNLQPEPVLSASQNSHKTMSHHTLENVSQRLHSIPKELKVHAKLEKLINERKSAIENNTTIDWGLAESLAYATLLEEGVSIRISGQDCGRGTFSHRQAIWKDQISNQSYFPLAHLSKEQGRFRVYNSPLSEMGVLGFDYGYSLIANKNVTIWEAQFGDFANGAQIMIDQYISSAEQKWGQTTNLILLLPHGFEGQGPEHSSARIERFLSLAAQNNMRIANPTTPAQLFHLIRNQVHLEPKPLIVFTPKALLRHPECVSHTIDLIETPFRPLINDESDSIEKVERIVLCSGKIYYDLAAYQKQHPQQRCAFIRIEQLYPLESELLLQMIRSYPHAKDICWVQEEPENMGAWSFMASELPTILNDTFKIRYIGRPRRASPAVGFPFHHKQELSAILHQVFKE